MKDSDIREQMVSLGASMFERGLTGGATGNLSARVEDGWLMTPTGTSLGTLDPARLSRLDSNGRHVDGDAPTKEAVLHTSVYASRPGAGAVVHLHSTHSVAVSCMADLNHENVLPPLTAYYVMRVGKLPLIPYHPPGDASLAEAVALATRTHHAVLLANHGPVVAGKTLTDAVYAVEELEETARLFLLLRDERVKALDSVQVEVLTQRFPVDF